MRRDCTPRLHSHDFLTPGTPAAKLDKEPCLVLVVRRPTACRGEIAKKLQHPVPCSRAAFSISLQPKPRHVHSRQKASPTAAFRDI
ncbi:hypothetical protein CEP54_006964 [Fusarium duplospermum]|uniref:Uncharacterized protein n=1 Tax=Fusarium duplospermum TaxID=1325734 RepID=A0A428Q462_9HYPO|nr:hypothetical protein CEP54_006964 [Fusarium duplospermum]